MFRFFINALFRVMFIGGCLVFDVLIGWQIYQVHDARARYVMVQGMVTESQVVGRRGSSSKKTYSPHIEYAYQAGTDDLHGDQYSYINWGTSGKKSAEQTIARHPVGSFVDVYYDPLKPEKAVLSMSYWDLPWLFFVLLPVFHLLALIAIMGIIKKPDNNQTGVA